MVVARVTDGTERPALRVVKPARKTTTKEAPAKKRAPRKVVPKSVAAAAASNDRRQMLVALRNRIAQAIDDPKTAGPALAALIKQQRDIMAEIALIDRPAAAATAPMPSVLATTPDEAWDESMI